MRTEEQKMLDGTVSALRLRAQSSKVLWFGLRLGCLEDNSATGELVATPLSSREATKL